MTDQPSGFSFKLGADKKDRPIDPEGLFRSLTTRSPQVPHPWSHQADIWRAYSTTFRNTKDVALELPTGSGKTLIGLVLAEFRRRAFDERVLYLCPTRQLANQVGERAAEYGIEAKVILSRDYQDLAKYQAGTAVGVTTYSGIFNTNPKFTEPHVIILDDAHASEDYIANMWSLRVSRAANESLFKDVAELLREPMGESASSIILDEDIYHHEDHHLVFGIPHPIFWSYAQSLRDLLNARLDASNNEWFAWSTIRDHLHACQIYCSWHQILVRPIIPPTLSHLPFANARQRIYMSATLGSGGELERISGVEKIDRFPMPAGWDDANMGRRLFIFPGIELDEADASRLVSEAIKNSERGLVLVPTNMDARSLGDDLATNGIEVFGSDDITDSLGAFTESKTSALVLANRYDGIDLPGDKCRLLILQGIPGGVNLQERFLLSRLGAQLLFRDRLRTRFTQGVGRCCRGATDYSTIIILGQQLFDFCSNIDVTKAMSPALQAEIRFGIDESSGDDTSVEKLLALIQHLNSRSVAWEQAEKHLQGKAAEYRKEKDSEADLLMHVVGLEVQFAYELWKKNYSRAIELGTKITDVLQEHNIADASRSWWLYLTGCVCFVAASETHDHSYTEKAIHLFSNASRCCNGVAWFAEIVHRLNSSSISEQSGEEPSEYAESAFQQLSKLGFFGPKFDRKIEEYRIEFSKNEATPFELSMERLGKHLGLHSKRFAETAAPDTIWYFEEHWTIAFEAKSDEDPNNSISLESTRQLLGHSAWVKNNFPRSNGKRIVAVLVSPRDTIDQVAADLAKEHADLFYVHVDAIRRLFETTAVTLRTVRSKSGPYNIADGCQNITTAFETAKLDPGSLFSILTRVPLSTMTVK